jgi:hypothetical protein
MSHKIIQECESLKWNRDKVQKWFSYGLSPKWGLSQELLAYMYKLYQDSSGDTSYVGRWGCFSCQMTIYQKLLDFLNYGDNLGKELINWEPTKKKNKNHDGKTKNKS